MCIHTDRTVHGPKDISCDAFKTECYQCNALSVIRRTFPPSLTRTQKQSCIINNRTLVSVLPHPGEELEKLVI